GDHLHDHLALHRRRGDQPVLVVTGGSLDAQELGLGDRRVDGPRLADRARRSLAEREVCRPHRADGPGDRTDGQRTEPADERSGPLLTEARGVDALGEGGRRPEGQGERECAGGGEPEASEGHGSPVMAGMTGEYYPRTPVT